MTSAYPALVLNADFAPISTYPLSVWDFQRTMRNTLKDRVTVLETYDAVLRSPSLRYRPPSVVALKRYVRRPSRAPFTRMNLFLRDDFRCQYCGGQHLPKDLTFDHVIPRCDGGGTNWENIVAACVPCNTRKGSRHDMRPMAVPCMPSAYDLIRRKTPETRNLHSSWMDYLYWSGVLESD
jgi:5-methylcytosine-specific restriction endonuclease McrA